MSFAAHEEEFFDSYVSDIHPPPEPGWPPAKLPSGQRRARMATFMMLLAGAVFFCSMSYYHNVVMPTPVVLVTN